MSSSPLKSQTATLFSLAQAPYKPHLPSCMWVSYSYGDPLYICGYVCLSPIKLSHVNLIRLPEESSRVEEKLSIPDSWQSWQDLLLCLDTTGSKAIIAERPWHLWQVPEEGKNSYHEGFPDLCLLRSLLEANMMRIPPRPPQFSLAGYNICGNNCLGIATVVKKEKSW